MAVAYVVFRVPRDWLSKINPAIELAGPLSHKMHRVSKLTRPRPTIFNAFQTRAAAAGCGSMI